MKTRISDLPRLGWSFQYTEVKHPLPRDWHFVGGDAAPAAWPTSAQRDRARACFTRRRSVSAALADLKRGGLL
ncbi:hypothetical protein [Aquabacterium sp.]|uniref:hypothetical protein n=1 Tax=Aquabacterium sp. TaxID=1872578 RepID=UPI0025C33929|nr:hypothetical protein [Aquabacterium sp.]